ncbi:hypothetical protein JD969_11795 [Planctomycetota bacterium]|nr:hypothetical protein JD969_11795 [Planctomycetota bacterium]
MKEKERWVVDAARRGVDVIWARGNKWDMGKGIWIDVRVVRLMEIVVRYGKNGKSLRR